MFILRTFVFIIILAYAALPAVSLSIGEVRLLPDTTPVQLDGKVITSIFSLDGYIYVEEPNRSAGIRVITSKTGLSVGDIINITGRMSTQYSGTLPVERRILGDTVSNPTGSSPVKPLMMTCGSVGGGDILPLVPGALNGYGLNNIGLLAQITGKVTYTSGSDIYVDDGSNVADILSRVGVRTHYPSSIVPVSTNDLVTVTGIIQGNIPTEAGWTANRRFIRMRTVSDLVNMNAQTGTITGSIKDSSGAAMTGVTVSTSTGGYSTTTAADGSYTIPNVSPGMYTITAMKAGYLPASKANQAIRAGRANIIDFSLSLAVYGAFPDNGDFESGFISGLAKGWSTWKGSWSNTITYAQDTSSQMAGTSTQRWGRADAFRTHGGVCKAVSTVPGVTYEIIAWLRMDSGDTGAWLEAGIDLTGQLTNGEAASISYTKLETGGNRNWLRYRKIVKATGNSMSFFTKFGHWNESTGPHFAYVDNVTIQPRTVLEAEDYVNAYDTTSGNTGGVYRSGDVDIASLPSGDGYVVGWTAAGEWLEWTNVGSIGGDHAIAINYSGWSNAVISVSIDGTNVSGSFSLPKSGWWDAYRRIVLPGVYSLAAGSHTIRLTIIAEGCNIDSLELVPVSACPLIQAEDSLTFNDTTTGNSGGQYRSDNLDVGLGTEGYYVGWTAPGEWMDFPVRGDARTYAAVIRYAGASTTSVSIRMNGNNVTGTVSLPSTGGAQVWRSVVTPVFTVGTGSSTLRLYIESGSPNINYIALIPLGDGKAGSQLMVGTHFAGSVGGGILDMASTRGTGQWIYSTEVIDTGGRDPEDSTSISSMTSWIRNYIRPMYQMRIRPIVRIDYVWGETIPRLLANNAIDTAAVSRYARTFKKFAQLAEANGVPVRHLVVANEMNIKGEATGFTNGYIPEWYYAYVYDAVQNEMKTLGPEYEVMVGGLSPGTFTVDPLQTPPTPAELYTHLSTDALVYLDNICQEIKRRGTRNVCFAMHAYNDFDPSRNYTTSFYWTIRKQMEVIEKSHTVVPYDQTQPVTIGGFTNAPVYITEWNRHTPQTSAEGRVFHETATSNFIRTAIERLGKYNRDRLIYDNVSNVYRTYDHRDVRHNFHPIKAVCYFVFDTLGGSWGDYSLKEWHTLSGSAEGTNDMYNTYQSQIGLRDPAGR